MVAIVFLIQISTKMLQRKRPAGDVDEDVEKCTICLSEFENNDDVRFVQSLKSSIMTL